MFQCSLPSCPIRSNLTNRTILALSCLHPRNGVHRATLLKEENEILTCGFLPGDRSVLASTGGGYFKAPVLYSVDLADGTSSARLKDYVPVWVLDRNTGLLCMVDSRETQGRATIIDTDTWQIAKSFSAEGTCILDAERRMVAARSQCPYR